MKHSTGIIVSVIIIAVLAIGYGLSRPIEDTSPPKPAETEFTQLNRGEPVQSVQVETPTELLTKLKETDHVRGDTANPQVVLIEYGDFECPFCKKFYPTTKKLLEAYPNDVAFVYRHFALPIHTNAPKQAEASECIAELGGDDKFWQFHDAIFERTKSYGLGFSIKSLYPLAREIGIDEEKFRACLDSGKYSEFVTRSLSEGLELGVEGTPTIIIVSEGKPDEVMVGAHSFTTLQKKINERL